MYTIQLTPILWNEADSTVCQPHTLVEVCTDLFEVIDTVSGEKIAELENGVIFPCRGYCIEYI